MSTERFARCWIELGASRSEPIADEHRSLVDRFNEDQRHYHTLQHVNECLGWLDEAPVSPEHRSLTELALWYHDAIYDPHRNDNEFMSAQLVSDAGSRLGAPNDAADRLHDLVLSTDHRRSMSIEGDDAAYLHDIDLSILGSSPAALPRVRAANSA